MPLKTSRASSHLHVFAFWGEVREWHDVNADPFLIDRKEKKIEDIGRHRRLLHPHF